eukprot:g9291.t1
MESILADTQDFVRQSLEGNDASHDYAHIERVYKLATNIAKQEQVTEEEYEIVALSALLHDIADWKYSGSETAGVEAAKKYLEGISGFAPEKVAKICWIIQRVSFHDEIGRSDEEINKMKQNKCLCIVQDADRLDAIGAIGIARCFTYGGKKKRPLYDSGNTENIVRKISKDDYMKAGRNAPTIDHFYEKLLLLKDMMKTNGGKCIANDRHEFMVKFLQQFSNEINGLC